MHFKVFLDSNVYDSSNYSFRNGLFTQLRKYATDGTLELQINTVVEGEIRRHIDQSISDKIKELNKLIASREFAGFRKLPEYMPVLETQDKERWIKTAQDEFSSLLQDCHAERIDLNNSDVEKVFGDYFNCRYPFEDNKKKKEEFPDAFIIQSILRRIEELSQVIYNHAEEKNQLVFKDIKSTVGGLEDLRFCIVSNDKGFWNALLENTCYRANNDVLLFSTLNELINYIETQNQRACELQKEINKGFAKQEIVEAIANAIEDLEYDVDEIDGEVEEVNPQTRDNIEYKASVISLQEEHDGWATVRLYIDSFHDATIHYIYVDEDESMWDFEEKKYLWKICMDKISKFRVEAPLTIEIKVQFDEDGDPIDTDFESFIDRPYEAVVGQKNLLEEIYWEKMPGEAEE